MLLLVNYVLNIILLFQVATAEEEVQDLQFWIVGESFTIDFVFLNGFESLKVQQVGSVDIQGCRQDHKD